MKKSLLPLIIISLALTGCARSYVIKLSNGQRITTASKPKLKGNTYYFKDARGQTRSIPQGRVSEVMPASMASKEEERFNPSAR